MMRKKKIVVLKTSNYNMLLKSLRMGCGDMTEFAQLIQHAEGEGKTKTHSDKQAKSQQSVEELISLQPLQISPVDNDSETNLPDDTVISNVDKPEISELFSKSAQPHDASSNSILSHDVASIGEPENQPTTLPAANQTSGMFDLLMYGVSTQSNSERSFIECLDDDEVYSRIPDILNPKLKIPSDIRLRPMKTPSERLTLLGKQVCR